MLDMTSGVAVMNAGQGVRTVIEAVSEQVSRFAHTMVYGEFVLSPQVQLAKKLASLLPPSLSVTYFTNSGAEAVEGAMKLAMHATSRSKFVAFEGAYHGDTLSALSLCGIEEYRKPFSAWMQKVEFLPYDETSALKRITEDVAGVIIEPVQGEAGIRVPSANFLKALREKTRKTGALLLFDEVQTGLGRTGKWFAFEHFGIVPDVLILAKALGGGLPLGAFCSSLERMRKFTRDIPFAHISTTGGNPVSCAAGLASLRYLIRKKTLLTVQKNAPWFLASLRQIAKDFPDIRSVHGMGYLVGVEFASPEQAKKVADWCLQLGLLVIPFLFQIHSLRFYPALTMSRTLLRTALEIFRKALALSSSVL